MMKQAMGWNFASDELGARIMSEIVELVRAKKVRPVIGEVVGFDELPAAMERMRDRKTTGRIVITID
jgi:NADPH:quinone reductase-like Zn-dependent oxidoreductase